MNNAIKIENLTLGFNDKILMRSASIEIPRGELIGLIGRNGVGKSTLLRCISGIERPLSGNIFVENQLMDKLTAQQRAQIVSFVATETIRINGLKVKDVVGFGRSPYTDWFGRLSTQDQQIVQEALKAVKMDSFSDKSIDTLSDGERQRVMIARALAQDTPVMILDEPTAFLDIPNKYQIVELLHNLTKDLNHTILYSTHDLDVAERYCDKLLIIDKGVFSIDSPQNIRQQGIIKNLFHI